MRGLAAATYVVVLVLAAGGAAAANPRAEAVLSVKGMVCPNCERTVESLLGGVDGVLSVEADREAEAAHVSYDPSAVNPQALVRVLQQGTYYRAGVTTGRAASPQPRRGGGSIGVVPPLLAALAAGGAVALLARLRRRPSADT